MLARAGPQAATAMIEQSILHGWIGLFEVKAQEGLEDDIDRQLKRINDATR